MNTKKLLALILAVLMLGALFTGCGKNSGDLTNGPSANPSTVPADNSDTPSPEPDDQTGTLPLVDVLTTLTAWSTIGSGFDTYLKSKNDITGYKEIEKRTNIHIEWSTPSAGQETTAWNLLMSSGDFPDLLEQASIYYLGGVDKAIEDEICIELTDVIENYMPNYSALIKSEKSFSADTKTDAGNIGYLYCIYTESQLPWMGLNVRKDWLDDLGLPEPYTYDDWYTMLKAFKEQKGADAPLMLTNVGDTWYGHYSGGFGVVNGFSQVDGKVIYGPIEQGFRDYLETFSKWYADGLIDKDFYTRTDPAHLPDSSFIYTGRAGAWAGIALWDAPVKSGAVTDTKFYAKGIHNPVVNKNDGFSHFRTISSRLGVGSMISSSCKNVELLAHWLDYCYSAEGSTYLNFGEENVHWYRDTDGNPIQDADGMEKSSGLPYDICKFLVSPVEAPYLRVMYRGDAGKNSTRPLAEDAYTIRGLWGEDKMDYTLPTAISLTVEEANTRANIMADIQTLVSEHMIAVIIGSESLDDWDSLVEQIKGMNIDEAIKVTQEALDRYNNR